MLKKFIFTLIFALVFAIGPQAFALNVPLQSGVCGQAPAFESTGFIFSHNGKTFVLASSEFVLNGDSYCHSVSLPSQATSKLKLLRYDWSTGLALLSGGVELNAVATPLVVAKQKILERVSWRTNAAGTVVAAQSQRHHYPGITLTFEIKSSGASRETVGSALTNAKGEIVGFLGNFFIEEIPGKTSRVSRWTMASKDLSPNLVAIPADIVVQWLTKVNSAGWTPMAQIIPDDQLKGVRRIHFGNLFFTEDCPPPDSEIGSDPDYPIGGNEGIGIGGDSSSMPGCNFEVSKAGRSAGDPSHRAPWLVQLNSYLDRGITVKIQNAFYRDEDNLLQSKAGVSIGHFGQLLRMPSRGFLLKLGGLPEEKRLVDLRVAAVRLIKNCRSFRWYGAINIHQRGYLYGMLSLTDDWKSVKLSDLEALRRDEEADPNVIRYILEATDQMIAYRKALGE
jgi:hypothetical protein